MWTSKMLSTFNDQINKEMFSSYLYLSMLTWLESKGLKGLAHWMRIQAQEEMIHAMKFIDFMHERDGRVLLTTIQAPQTEWDSPVDAFEDVCQHEAEVTASINKLVDQSIAESDHAANAFLQWFVTEQVEEEATAREIRDKLRLAGDNGAVLYMIDQELGGRAASPSTVAAAQ